uniref:NADH dehydrogenase subunit 6 n=1 Tax=Haustorioides koreanus TaxID=2729224 RepID=A0A6M3RW63_9CRUS|nr:NADH dehydrogenase subunit 6 [Haustorioides koreanus]
MLTFFTGGVLLSSLLFMSLNTPLSMGITVILLSFFVAVMMALLMPTTWFSFLLLMVFLSGMMVLFVYVASLASNELFVWDYVSVFLLVSLSALFVGMSRKVYCPGVSGMDFSLNNISSFMVYKMYSPHLYYFTLLLIVYLLVVLIVVVKNATISESPLRAKK